MPQPELYECYSIEEVISFFGSRSEAQSLCNGQASMITFASARERNHSRLRHSSRSLPLNLSVTPFLPRLAGLDQRGADALRDYPRQ